MDYKSLSDYRLNKMVGDSQGVQWANLDDNYHRLSIWFGGDLLVYSPCTDAKQAFYIIEENKIATYPDGSDDGKRTWWNAQSSCGQFEVQQLSNPLRAAMIVYLMMKENANV